MKQSELYRLAQTFLAPKGSKADGICHALSEACFLVGRPSLAAHRGFAYWKEMFNDRNRNYWWPGFSPANQQERFMVLELMALMTEDEE